MKWQSNLKIILLTLALMTKLGFSATSVTDNALDLAYSLQIDAIKTQVKFETLQSSYDLRIKQLESENTRYWWIMVAGTIAMGYAVAK